MHKKQDYPVGSRQEAEDFMRRVKANRAPHEDVYVRVKERNNQLYVEVESYT